MLVSFELVGRDLEEYLFQIKRGNCDIWGSVIFALKISETFNLKPTFQQVLGSETPRALIPVIFGRPRLRSLLGLQYF